MTTRLFLSRRFLLAAALLLPAALPGEAAPRQKKIPPAAAVAPLPPGVPPFEVAGDEKMHLWYGRFGLTNCAWFEMGNAVAVVDSGASERDTKNLVAQVKEKTRGKPIRWVILTHFHGDSNSGLPALVGPDMTIFVNARAAAGVSEATSKLVKTGRKPVVVGVSGKAVLAAGGRVAELFASEGAAHTGLDLFAWLPDAAAAIVGDLVTPGRCPMTSDPECDPAGWTGALDLLDKLHPAFLVATRGNVSIDSAVDVKATRDYLKRLVDLLSGFKAQGFPDTRVSGELAARKMGEYCPQQLDAVNALGLYARITPDGRFNAPTPRASATLKGTAKK